MWPHTICPHVLCLSILSSGVKESAEIIYTHHYIASNLNINLNDDTHFLATQTGVRDPDQKRVLYNIRHIYKS